MHVFFFLYRFDIFSIKHFVVSYTVTVWFPIFMVFLFISSFVRLSVFFVRNIHLILRFVFVLYTHVIYSQLSIWVMYILMFWFSFLGSLKNQEYAEDMFLFCIAFEPDRIVKNGSIIKNMKYIHAFMRRFRRKWEDTKDYAKRKKKIQHCLCFLQPSHNKTYNAANKIIVEKRKRKRKRKRRQKLAAHWVLIGVSIVNIRMRKSCAMITWINTSLRILI